PYLVTADHPPREKRTMLLTSLLQRLKRSAAQDGSTCSQLRKRPLGPRRGFVPGLEALEDRTALSTLPVVNNFDSGPGSLRAALVGAAPGDTIVFAPSVHKITLTSGELAVTKSLTILGPGSHQLTLSGNDASRVFDVSSGTVTIAGLTITRGRA